jgi:hypothetical protein
MLRPRHAKRESDTIVPMSNAVEKWRRSSLSALRQLKRFLTGRRDFPGDLYAYVTAPRKPRSPHFSASAVAEKPND